MRAGALYMARVKKHIAPILYAIGYFALLPVLILCLKDENPITPGLIIIAVVWWLLCAPGYLIIWSVLNKNG